MQYNLAWFYFIYFFVMSVTINVFKSVRYQGPKMLEALGTYLSEAKHYGILKYKKYMEEAGGRRGRWTKLWTKVASVEEAADEDNGRGGGCRRRQRQQRRKLWTKVDKATNEGSDGRHRVRRQTVLGGCVRANQLIWLNQLACSIEPGMNLDLYSHGHSPETVRRCFIETPCLKVLRGARASPCLARCLGKCLSTFRKHWSRH